LGFQEPAGAIGKYGKIESDTAADNDDGEQETGQETGAAVIIQGIKHPVGHTSGMDGSEKPSQKKSVFW